MKIKTLAFIAAAVMTGALFCETTVEGIGVTSDGFIFKKTCLGDSASGGLGQFHLIGGAVHGDAGFLSFDGTDGDFIVFSVNLETIGLHVIGVIF